MTKQEIKMLNAKLDTLIMLVCAGTGSTEWKKMSLNFIEEANNLSCLSKSNKV